VVASTSESPKVQPKTATTATATKVVAPKKAVAKKTAPKKAAAKKATPKKATPKKATPKKAAAKKATPKKAAAKKATPKKAAAKKPAVSKAEATKAVPKKAASKKTAVNKGETKKASPKKTPVKIESTPAEEVGNDSEAPTQELSKEELAEQRQLAHWEKTRIGVLSFVAKNGGQASLREMHDHSERRFFVAHQSFSRLMEELTNASFLTYDFDSGVATLTDEGRAAAV
jgi:hypothetical protein